MCYRVWCAHPEGWAKLLVLLIFHLSVNLSEESVILCHLASVGGPVRGEVSEQVVEGSGVVHDSLLYLIRGKVQDIFIDLKDFFS
jgi:hypothetical protein